MLDQLMDFIERDNRPGEKKRNGLRGFLQRLGGDGDDHAVESSRDDRRRNQRPVDLDDDHPSSRRRDRDAFDFD